MSSGTISLFLPSLEGGGAERVFVQLANEFCSRGCCVDFALAKAFGPFVDEISSGVRVLDFEAAGVLRAVPKLVRYLRTEQPRIVLSALDHANIAIIFACLFARHAGRCVISVRSVPTAVYRRGRSVRGWLLLQLMRIMYRLPDEIIANSKAVATDLSRHLGIPEGRVRVIHNPIDIGWIEKMSRAEAEHPWCKTTEVPVIVGVGSLTPLKDFSTLIRAFSILRSQRACRLVILGEGPERKKLERLVHELDLLSDVYMPGFAQNPFPWISTAKVFVSSSLTEGCPNVLLQTLACGTPIVSTNCKGGSAEVLEDGKWGRLVPVGEAAALAEGISETLDANDCPDLRKRAPDFALSKIADQYLNVLFGQRAPSA